MTAAARARAAPPSRARDAADALAPVALEAADPHAHAAAVVAASGSSFAAGMRILAPPRRRAMHAIYAFCRIVDDIADGDLPRPRKRALLAAWAREIALAAEGRAVSPVGRALAEAIRAHDLPVAEFGLMLEGMGMDADGPVVAPPEATLARYARCVAGSVGLLSMRAFGAWVGAPSERFGLALADALQFVNILRDIEEDAALGRLYLPAEALARAGVPPDPAAALAHPGLPAACAEIGARARARFSEARAELGAHRRARLAPALLMMGPYEGYLDLMAARGWRRGAPVRLGRWRKLALGLRCVLAG
jgi:phytoene synthase